MDLDKLRQKLIQAGRLDRPADTVPYAFEKRIMARLKERCQVDALAYWSRMLWRAAVSSVAVMLLISAWTVLSPEQAQTSLSDEFETTVLAGLPQINDGW